MGLDFIIQIGVGLVAIYMIFKIAYFTIKRVAIHLITGYAAYYIAVNYFHIPMDMGLGMWALSALFGPIPVIAMALWQHGM
ncbi:hypothetical protein [uncultured Veillonella sp.]|uniref:hypothetical protein n=1 Tax=uncultured Veillonella sp. TaxID=159268 RepID=UPI002612E0F9|nr:hypothetical protein [uncultured Veillonella sp.]